MTSQVTSEPELLLSSQQQQEDVYQYTLVLLVAVLLALKCRIGHLEKRARVTVDTKIKYISDCKASPSIANSFPVKVASSQFQKSLNRPL